MLASDYFMRDKDAHPTASIAARFSAAYYTDRRGTSYKTIQLSYPRAIMGIQQKILFMMV